MDTLRSSMMSWTLGDEDETSCTDMSLHKCTVLLGFKSVMCHVIQQQADEQADRQKKQTNKQTNQN